MSEINEFYEKIYNYNKTENSLSTDIKSILKEQIITLFPNLKKYDVEKLNELSYYLTYQIVFRFLSNLKKQDLIEQLSQNNYRDIKAIILLLLPFISDKDNFKRFKLIQDLNQIIYFDYNKENIDSDILQYPITDTLKNEFQISNFGIGLLNDNQEILLNLKENNIRIIDKIMNANLIAIIENLKIINGKLYVNWINIVPITEEEYKNSDIYINSKDFILKFVKNRYNSELIRNYNGLWLGDYFNVYRNGFYQNIKKIKWTIYIYNKKYFIQILNEFFNLKNNIEGKYLIFESLPEEIKYDFTSKFSEFINSSSYSDILKNLIVFMVNNYKYRRVLAKNNELDKFKLDNIDEEGYQEEFIEKRDRNKFNNLTFQEIKEGLKLIGPEHFYNYLNEVMDIFKNTIYGTFLIKKDKSIDDTFYFLKINEKETKLNLKNIYNISKLLSHNYNRLGKEWRILKSNFISLNFDEQIYFLKRFSENNVSNWLNLNNNLKLESNFEEINIQERFNEIVKDWNLVKQDLVFIYLVRNGLLSKFNSDLNITNTLNLPSGYKDANKKIEFLMKKKFDDNPQWKDAYYFLTNEKYSEIKKMRVEKPIVNVEEVDYFSYTAKYEKWFKYYAMDWITQISFFNKYINHQVIYVTGATGQGKSTQVPKLLLYGLKMIDYKENGKIVCSQPRIDPTINNADTISNQLGVPIIQPALNNTFKINTNNYYIQYKYQGDSHTTLSNHLNLKLVTDGTLFVEIKNNIFMKEKIPTNNKQKFKYGEENYYDIIIVDEAHEHNRNMDLILTMARNTCYSNNSVKLVIISATMEDDEPIYRSYFKKINDNIKYPIRNLDLLNSDNDNPLFPQRIYMDRRFDISPPGVSTQYKIEEEYINLPENEDNLTNAKNAQKKSFETVLEICNKTSEGEILLFSIGQKEIQEAVEYLNKKLPYGNIALPFFGKMNDRYKSIISKIDKNISKIKNKRERIHLEWTEDFIEDKSVSENIYKRAIIVATNVAEASVTIPRLKYVIDNGYAKESLYDSDAFSNEFIIDKISESSRVQRKGRVGRTGDGYAYFMYLKNARADIKPKYKISQQNSGEIFTQLCSLHNSPYDEIYPPEFDPHFYRFYVDLYLKYGKDDEIKKKILDSDKKLMKSAQEHIQKSNYFNETGADLIIEKQFYLEEIFEKFSDFFFSFLKQKEPPSWMESYIDGFPMSLLQDLNCDFYLIHPFEKEILRNCMNQLIKFKFGDNFKLVSKLNNIIYDKIIEPLSINLQIVNLKPNDNFKTDYVKTLFSDKVEDLKNKTLGVIEDDQFIFTLMYSYGYNVFDETIMIISILKSCNFSIKKLASSYLSSKNKLVYNFDKLKNKFLSRASDIESLYRLTQFIKNNLLHLKIFNIEKENLLLELKNKYDNLVQKYLIFIEMTNDLLNPPSQLIEHFNILNKINKQGKLGKKNGFLEWLNSSSLVKKFFISDIEANKSKINEFCKNNFLNTKTIISFLTNYFFIKNSLITIDKDSDSFLNEKNSFDWIDRFRNNFNSVGSDYSTINKIEDSFLFGFIKRVAIKINKYEDFSLVISPEIKCSVEKTGNIFESFVTNFNSALLYLNLSKKNTLQILINVEPNKLFQVNPLFFNKVFFNDLYLNKKATGQSTSSINIYEKKGCFYDQFLEGIRNNINFEKILLSENQENDEKDKNLNKYIKIIKDMLSS